MIAYRIDFEESILTDTNNIFISSSFNTYNIHDCELRIGKCIDNKQYFKLVCPNEVFSFYLFIEEEKFRFYFEDKDKSEPEISKRNRSPVRLTKYFNENPPVIWYIGTSSLQGNVLLKALAKKDSFFPDGDFIKWDWNSMNVDIQIESQLGNDGSKKINSIQYATIDKLKKSENYSVIFDDDGSGEIADIVAIAEEDDEILVELYHCKYSNGKIPGARINDLYEVCGQTEKSVFWKSDGVGLINRMKYRESKRLRNSSVSRFELGNINALNIIQKKMLHKQIKMKIFMVQPGVDSSKISPEMRVILGGTRDFCRDTFSVSVKLICS